MRKAIAIRPAGRRRVLAVASGGGHWVQMLRLGPAFQEAEVHYASTEDVGHDVAPAPYHQFLDANRDTKLKLMVSAVQIAWIVLKVRPHVVVTTGAAPGYLAIRFAGLFGARSMFIDSVANGNELSLSAHLARRHADRLVTQWPEVAAKTDATYHGSVL